MAARGAVSLIVLSNSLGLTLAYTCYSPSAHVSAVQSSLVLSHVLLIAAEF